MGIKMLKKLTQTFGVSGREGEINKVITEYVSGYADEIRTDGIDNLIVFKAEVIIWSDLLTVDDAGLIVYLDTQFPDPFYTDFFIVLLMAIDSKQEISDQSRKNLHHKAILAPGNQMVHTKMAFPPCKEFLNVTSEFIDKSNLFCC